MTKETYLKMTDAVRKNKRLFSLVRWTDKLLAGMIFFAYPALIVFLIVEKSPQVLSAVAVPGISFVVVSVFRRIYCAPRPYEVFQVPPVIPKDTVGKSFPSRHVFSIYLIAITFYQFNPFVGILMAVAGLLMATVRVLGGVHFPKDVAAGMALGILCGWIGFLIA